MNCVYKKQLSYAVAKAASSAYLTCLSVLFVGLQFCFHFQLYCTSSVVYFHIIDKIKHILYGTLCFYVFIQQMKMKSRVLDAESNSIFGILET